MKPFKISPKRFLRAFLIATIVLIIVMVFMMRNRLSFSGFYTDRILFWLWAFWLLSVIVIFRKKIITKIFSGFLILLLIGMTATRLPIIIFLDVTTGNNLVFNKRLDDNFRLQISRSVMVPSFIKIFQKWGIFEKTVYAGSGLKNNGIRADEIKNAKLIKKTDSSLIIKYQTEKESFTENYDFKK